MVFTLRFANRYQYTQDWIVQTIGSLTLDSNYVQSGQITVNNNYTFGIAVNTDNLFAAAILNYWNNPPTWTLNSHTSNEFELQQGQGIVTVRCFLENGANDEEYTVTNLGIQSDE